MGLKRNYSYKDVDMLMASKTISESFKDNLSELSMARTNWTEEYANQLSQKIDDAIENQLGIDKKKELREASAKVQAIMQPALRDISFLKTQIEVDFSNDKSTLKELLKTLGFTTHLKRIQKRDQEALISMLYQFKTNLTGQLRNSLTSNGLNPALLDRIVGYADTLKNANVSQETLKEGTKAVSNDITALFNDIYSEIIGICKIASNFYQYDELKKELFTFSKVVENMNATRKVVSEGSE